MKARPNVDSSLGAYKEIYFPYNDLDEDFWRKSDKLKCHESFTLVFISGNFISLWSCWALHNLFNNPEQSQALS